jgi:threonine/homoserine efflux transporter RhtA
MNVSRRNTKHEQSGSNATNASTNDAAHSTERKPSSLSFSSQSWSQLFRKFTEGLFEQVPIHSIVFLRVFWGIVMLYEMWTYMAHDYRKAQRYLVDPGFMFQYWAFEW